MSRTWKVLVVLLAVQAGLSAAAVVAETGGSCVACRSGSLSPAVAGALLYIGLLAAALTRGPSRLLFGFILLGFGVHVALATQLFLAGIVCGLCIAATAGSIALVALSIAVDPGNLGRLAVLAPWSALLVATLLPLRAPDPPTDGSVRVMIFTQPDCPYCDELRDRVMPEIEREFGGRVKIDYRPAAEVPAVRQTPTLILTSGRVGARPRVIEGLPTLERLRGAILDLEIRT